MPAARKSANHDKSLSRQIAPYRDERGNSIIGRAKGSGSVTFSSTGCELHVSNDVWLWGDITFHAPNGKIFIDSGSRYRGVLRTGLNSSITIGKNLSVTGSCLITAAESQSVTIGNDCMFATGNQIRSDDAHAFYDLSTGKRLNHSQSIKVGDHVWLAYEAAVLKGITIGQGSIIGMRAVVTKDVPENCLAIGTPARVARKNVMWRRPHLSRHEPHYFPDLDLATPGIDDDENANFDVHTISEQEH